RSARVRSPEPPATSSTRLPSCTPLCPTANHFHRRCMPADIRSFIRSYCEATEWKTLATLRALSSARTFSKPKSVSLMELKVSMGMMAAAAAAAAGGCGGGLGRRRARGAQLVLVFRPQAVAVQAQLIEVLPGIDAGIVPV